MPASRKKSRRAAKTAQAAKSESSGRESRGLMIRVNSEGLRAIRLLAVERDVRIQALGVEALNDLLEKYGKNPVVKNPLAHM